MSALINLGALLEEARAMREDARFQIVLTAGSLTEIRRDTKTAATVRHALHEHYMDRLERLVDLEEQISKGIEALSGELLAARHEQLAIAA